MTEWHAWFAYYPVYSFEYGWVWLRELHRKQIPRDYVDPAPKAFLSGCQKR